MMAIEKKLTALFAPVVLAFSSLSAQATELTQTDRAQLEASCAVIHEKVRVNKEEAAACVQGYYQAATAKLFEIRDAIDDERFSEKDNKSARELELFDKECRPFLGGIHSDFSQAVSAESYLRTPQNCLSLMSRIADRHDMSYDEDGTGYLIHRLRLLRRLSLD